MSDLGREVEARLRTQVVARPLVFRPAIDSTSTLARQLAEQGASHGTAVLAGTQTAGRGRRGRTWTPFPGRHVFTSVILRPLLPPGRVPELTLLAAAAVADALRAVGAIPRIKWPNDVELDGRKACGILSEMNTDAAGRVVSVILGIGVNVECDASDIPDELRDRATSVRASIGRAVSAADVAAQLYESLEGWLERHAGEGYFPVLEAVRTESATIGFDVRATLGEREIIGRAIDLDPTGALLVRDATGTMHRIVAGDVERVRRS